MYESFYKLTASPFLLNPDPSFFFGSKGHAGAFAHLKYGVFQGEGFIVVTGEIGAGKTTLLRHLMQELDSQEVVAAQLVSTQLGADDLLQSVAAAFGLPMVKESKAQQLASLEAFLTSLAVQHKRALLIVDEAQHLSPAALEELRMLSNFQLGTRSLLQSFLVGQPELRKTLQAPGLEQFRQRVTSAFHLGPVGQDETRRYIEHRLQCVGWTNDPTFTAPAFVAIHEASGGIPRRINSICSRLMLYGFLSEKHEINEQDVAAVVREMQFELGVESSAPADASASANSELSTGQSAVAETAQGTTTQAANVAVTESSARNEAVVRPFAYSSIVARLDRIERALATALELLRALPPTDRRPRGSRGSERSSG